jgi:hypothetical protein
VETAVNACVAVSYSVPIRVTGGINATARLLGAERPAKPPAKHAGSLPLRTRAISKGPTHVARVQAWRSRHPRYWSRAGPLQDHSLAQPVDFASEVGGLARPALQDFLAAQPAVLIGLIAHLVGTPLQDSIARTTDRLLSVGQDILAAAATSAGRPRPEPRTRSPPEP